MRLAHPGFGLQGKSGQLEGPRMAWVPIGKAVPAWLDPRNSQREVKHTQTCECVVKHLFNEIVYVLYCGLVVTTIEPT